MYKLHFYIRSRICIAMYNTYAGSDNRYRLLSSAKMFKLTSRKDKVNVYNQQAKETNDLAGGR